MIARHTVLVVVVAFATIWAFGIGSVAAHPVGSGPTASGASAYVTPLLDSSATSPAKTSPAVLSASHSALEQKIFATAQSNHLPLEALGLPNLVGQAKVTDGVVTPGYSTSPAPMGLATYGVQNTTGTPQAYTILTSSWEGTMTIHDVNTFLLDNDGAISSNGAANTFGIQLNAVTSDTTLQATSTYSFWTQNVLYFNFPYPGYVTLLDNVWNFSSPAFELSPGTIYAGNGSAIYPTFYYAFGPTFAYTLPLTIHLYLNSSTTHDTTSGYGYTTVRFGFSLVNANTRTTEASGIYDTVLFNSSTPYAQVPASPFLVDGSQLTPTGFIPYDAEIMLGGPGGGTTTSVYGFAGSASLRYWDATQHLYLYPPSAWNVASETGETVEGLDVTYTTPGTVHLSAGPSIPMPLWGATPGGNLGQGVVRGPLNPSNAFVFVTPGDHFDANTAAWAPTQTATSVHYLLPPGKFTVTAMLSDYRPLQVTLTVQAGHSQAVHFQMHRDFSMGVYTPLTAWNNAQLKAISIWGNGNPMSPYHLFNNPAPGGLNPVFGQFNDYLYQVFAGVLLAGTTAYTELNHPSLLAFTYESSYVPILEYFGLPLTNNLQFELVDASHVSIWHAQGITGWFFFEDYGPTGFLPLANVVVWGGSQNLIGGSQFVSQGSSLLLAGPDPYAPTGNVVWGNTFVNSTELTPTMYPGDGANNGPPIAIFAFEAGDLIYNNWIGTSITAFAPDANMFFGSFQYNNESWNLPMVEPGGHSFWFNGHDLRGTIVPSRWQGGNYWIDYVAGLTPLPYDEYGFIAQGGDYFPLPITAHPVVFLLDTSGYGGVQWSVTLNGVTQTTWGTTLTFYETPGTYLYSDTVVHGTGSITPSSGTVNVDGHSVHVHLVYTR